MRSDGSANVLSVAVQRPGGDPEWLDPGTLTAETATVISASTGGRGAKPGSGPRAPDTSGIAATPRPEDDGNDDGAVSTSQQNRSNTGVSDEANFAQRQDSREFGSTGSFSGKTVDDVASALKSGSLTPRDVPVQIIRRDGNVLILNTRSAAALERAGIPRSRWASVDKTGERAAEFRLDTQLRRNRLDSRGTKITRQRAK